MSLKLKIFEQEDSSTKEVTLKLEDDGDGGVSLVSVDSDGDSDYYLLTINANGKVYFHSGIPEELGFPVDDDGELFVDED